MCWQDVSQISFKMCPGDFDFLEQERYLVYFWITNESVLVEEDNCIICINPTVVSDL